MEYFSEKYGLVTDNDPVTENGQLFLATYALLLYYRGTEKHQQDYIRTAELMKLQLYNSQTDEIGLYNRNPDLTDRRIMSHDNLIGIMCWSHFMNTHHRVIIWDYLFEHFGTYDNSRDKSPQLSRFLPFSPQTLFVLLLCSDSKLKLLLGSILFPFFLGNLIVGCNKPKKDSSGKILDFISLYALSDYKIIRMCRKYYEKKMKKQYGEDYIIGLMNQYHGGNSKEFPINKLLNN